MMTLSPQQLFKLVTVALTLTILSGCATPVYKSKQDLYPKMYKEKPQSILVVPAINDTTAADAGDLYIATIAPPITWHGYYVMPTEITTPLLQDEGITDGRQLLNVPAQKFKTLFGADAVLFVNLTKWDTNYNVISGGVTTGETLWTHSAERTIDTSGNNNNGGGLIGALIVTALKTAMQDYLPVAQQMNNAAVYYLPAGHYHPLAGKDGQVKNIFAGYEKK